MTDSEGRAPAPIVIETPAQAAILLHLLDDLATVLDLAAQTPADDGTRRAYAGQLAGEVRAVRTELCPPEADPPGWATAPGNGARRCAPRSTRFRCCRPASPCSGRRCVETTGDRT